MLRWSGAALPTPQCALHCCCCSHTPPALRAQHGLFAFTPSSRVFLPAEEVASLQEAVRTSEAGLTSLAAAAAAAGER